MFSLTSALLAATACLVLSNAQTLTGPTDCTPAGGFTLCQNLWGASKILENS